MLAQRARSAVAAEHRSIHPGLAGVPWWAAILIAATATAVGFAFDAGSGNKELTHVFAALYVLGCVTAVLAVQQSGVFTAVIQPPLILFCSVPGAYWLFHGAAFPGLKNILINCGYPLIERFPLMVFTSAAVLLIGLVRWYIGMATRLSTASTPKGGAGPMAGIVAKLTSLVGRPSAGDDAPDDNAATKTRRHTIERPARSGAATRGTRATKTAKATKRTAPTRSRHIRPPVDDPSEPPIERPRRRRPDYARDADAAPEPRRRPREREPRDPNRRGQPPREGRADPHVRKGRPTRTARVDPYESADPPERPRRRQPVVKGTNGASSTHHPISRVRYRGATDKDAPQPRPRRKSEPESWEYDI
ncbi:DUF6542 domain-containing protein [Mycobacterium sp. pUA109]|uniref:DUF6542 domain-containing protein n=1 Tax=Mycobacterium sp. pUA109 TaxID=3238982 RepID=UPI00351ABBFE